jgi:hypothetical protein
MPEPAAPAPAPPASPPPPPPASPPPPPWYQGAIEPEVLGLWQNKGYDYSDPVKLTQALTKSYREAESRLGAPANMLLRLPKDASDEAGWNAVHERLGVPKEGKEYDFAAVKMKDGSQVDQGFTDAMRKALHRARVSKENAPAVVKSVVDFLEASDAAEAAELSGSVADERAELEKNWGAQMQANMFMAAEGLRTLAHKVNISEDEAKHAWDTLSTIGGLGAAKAMEMLRLVGELSREPGALVSGSGAAANRGLMSRESALAEIVALKGDKDFSAKLFKGDRESRRTWDRLHQIAHGQQRAG